MHAQEGRLEWGPVICKGFTVKEVCEGMTRDSYIKKDIHLDELSESSILFMKKIKEKHDRKMCLLELTFDNHAIVYNLQPENRYEVSLIHGIDKFSDPIKFAMTGFDFRSKEKSLIVNNSHTLGFQQPFISEGNIGITRAYSEIDL